MDTITLSEAAEARLQFWTAPDDAIFPASVIAPVLGVSTKTLANWRSDDIGPRPCKRARSQPYYRKSTVRAWMEGEVAAV